MLHDSLICKRENPYKQDQTLVAQKCLKQPIHEVIIKIFQIRDETECRVFLCSRDVENFFSGQDSYDWSSEAQKVIKNRIKLHFILKSKLRP